MSAKVSAQDEGVRGEAGCQPLPEFSGASESDEKAGEQGYQPSRKHFSLKTLISMLLKSKAYKAAIMSK